MFSCESCEISKNMFLSRTYPVAASIYCSDCSLLTKLQNVYQIFAFILFIPFWLLLFWLSPVDSVSSKAYKKLYKKVFFKIWIFLGKYVCWSLSLIKLLVRSRTLLQKMLRHRFYAVYFLKFSGTIFYTTPTGNWFCVFKSCFALILM